MNDAETRAEHIDDAGHAGGIDAAGAQIRHPETCAGPGFR
jgi:hypothetical protein